MLNTIAGTVAPRRGVITLDQNTVAPESPLSLPAFAMEAVGWTRDGEFTLTFVKNRHVAVSSNVVKSATGVVKVATGTIRTKNIKRSKSTMQNQKVQRLGGVEEAEAIDRDAEKDRKVASIQRSLHKTRLTIPLIIQYSLQEYEAVDARDKARYENALKENRQAQSPTVFKTWLFTGLRATWGSGIKNGLGESAAVSVTLVPKRDREKRHIQVIWKVSAEGMKISKGFDDSGVITASMHANEEFSIRADANTDKNSQKHIMELGARAGHSTSGTDDIIHEALFAEEYRSPDGEVSLEESDSSDRFGTQHKKH
ncbi:hypothetical protein OG311_00075 [Streptomyces sp. NBC_01343]|uniref:hypothetical protein n=1 Tax=Streptomyces sp. NBC_01343 TaxID=2903832 RepID=UPI002E0F6EAD|nr:hypothetical protein OG311_00075 [Streptomyces sp. NBC_01343]